MRSWRPSWLVAPALLVGVASFQIVLATQADLSPWLGGGFGMFASMDSRSERHLLLYVDSPGLTRTIRVPEALEEQALRVRVLPTPDRIRDFAEAVLARERARIPGVSGVRVELWRNHREPGSLAPNESLVRRVRVEARRLGD
jgi:hypothetical protein